MSRSRRKAAKGRKEEAQIVKMPDAFTQGIMQLQQAILMKLGTAKETRDDIPADWVFNLQRGGFVPPPGKRVSDDKAD